MSCDIYCAGSRENLKRAIIEQAERIGAGKEPPQTAEEVIEGWIAQLFDQTVLVTMLNGKTVVSTTEASGSVTFHVPDGSSGGPAWTLDLLQEILNDIRGVHRQIKRIRQCYDRALP